MSIFDKLSALETQYDELMQRLGTSEMQSDQAEYRKGAKTLSELEPVVQKFGEYKQVQKDLDGAEELLRGSDADMRELAQEELKGLEQRREVLLGELRILLIPKDPNDERNVLLEIRAGTGGDEAACSQAISSACTRALPSVRVGSSRCCRAAKTASAESKR